MANDVLLNGVDGRGMTFTRVGSQDVEEVGKARHCNRLEGLLVSKIAPVLFTGAAVSAYQFDIVLRQGESSGKELFCGEKVSVLVANFENVNSEALWACSQSYLQGVPVLTLSE